MINSAFKFYSVLKNEDAMPYIGGNLLVAADGLGGSGSAVHHINRAQYWDIHGEIMRGVFGDMAGAQPELMQYIEELIAPLLDEKDDTSALWASRIVIARCVYALTQGEFKDADLGDRTVRANLAAFIAKGLHDAVETFDLQNGEYSNQLLLPTTLALIRYSEQEDSVIAETVWAGDSRCYALTPTGLKLLSVDDEDSSGSLTNLFYADNPKIQLNYLRHEIQKPCILMAVSDGIFDHFEPYDYLGVEQTMLSAIAQSGSEQELVDGLYQLFDRIHGDDATMAFVSFGFADFADMKQAFKERTDKILSVWQRQREMYSALEVMNLSEEEASHYVASRTSDRYDRIIPMLTDAMERGVYDIAITPEIRNIVENAQNAYKAAAEKARRERREHALTELGKYVVSHPETMIPGQSTSIVSSGAGALHERLYIDLKQAAENFIRQRDEEEKWTSMEDDLDKKKEDLHQMITERIADYQKRFATLWVGSLFEREEIERILSEWYFIDNALKGGKKLQEKRIRDALPVEEREFAIPVKNHLNRRKHWQTNMNTQKKFVYAAKKNYEQAWKKLFDRLRSDAHLIDILFNEDTIVKFGLAEKADDGFLPSITKIDAAGLMKDFKDRKAAVVKSIVEALAFGYNETSIIDTQYNETRLKLFRTYYILRNNPSDDIKELEKELLALEAQYTSLLNRAKG